MRGESDWIVMKCLEKDRNRRYETAIALSRDVENYLHDEPVQACPPSATYKFRKYFRRHKTAIATVMIVTVLLVADSVFSTWQAVRAIRREAAANDARIEAEAAAEEARIEAEAAANKAHMEAEAAAQRRVNDFHEGRYALIFQRCNPEEINWLLDSELDPTLSGSAWDAQIVAELCLVDGESHDALEAMNAAKKQGGEGFKSYPKTLGWVLLANGKKEAARAAFEKAIEPLKQPDGSYDLTKASGDHLTAAYFLDMISEERYLDRFAKKDVVKWGENQDVNVSFPWFYIGQRREIEGKAQPQSKPTNTQLKHRHERRTRPFPLGD